MPRLSLEGLLKSGALRFLRAALSSGLFVFKNPALGKRLWAGFLFVPKVAARCPCKLQECCRERIWPGEKRLPSSAEISHLRNVPGMAFCALPKEGSYDFAVGGSDEVREVQA